MALWTRVTMCLEILLFVRLWLKEMDRYNDQLSQNGKYFSDKNENDDRYLIYARLSPAASTATTRPGLWWILRYSNALLKLSDLAPTHHRSRHMTYLMAHTIPSSSKGIWSKLTNLEFTCILNRLLTEWKPTYGHQLNVGSAQQAGNKLRG